MELLQSVSAEQQFEIASVIFATLVGGFVSLISSLLVMGVAEFWRSRSEKKRAEIVAARHAFSGLQKLVTITNTLLNLKKFIDSCFEEADQNGMTHLDPAQKVRPLVGAIPRFERLSIDEMYFLAEVKQSNRMNDIELLYRRACNDRDSLLRYSDLRMELDNYLASSASDVQRRTGVNAVLSVNENVESVHEIKLSSLNSLLGQLMEHLAENCSEGKAITESYLRQAKQHFGDKFPKVSVEWEN